MSHTVYDSHSVRPSVRSSSLNVGGAPRVPSPAQVAEWVIVGLGTWQRRHRERCALANLDERLARDAGFEMADIAAEAAKPFWRA